MVAVIFNLLKVFALLPVFLLLSIFVFYTPGYLLINQARLKLRDDEKIVLSTGLGLIVFLIIAILFALLKVRFLVPFIYLGLTLYALYKFKNENFLPFARIFKQKLLMLFLLAGTLVEGFINFPSGFPFKEGYLYWSSQGHDGLWHVAIIEAIKKTFLLITSSLPVKNSIITTTSPILLRPNSVEFFPSSRYLISISAISLL